MTANTPTVDYASLPVVTEENEEPCDNYDEHLAATYKRIMMHHEQCFESSLLQQSYTNSISQQSYQNSVSQQTHSTQRAYTMLRTASYSTLNTQSVQNTQSIVNTRTQYINSSTNTLSNTYIRYDNFNDDKISRPSKGGWFGKGIRNLRSASLSISMLAKPSDDRRANSVLAGWNVGNLIQGTTILGMPYAFLQGGWATIAVIFITGFISCHTGKLLIECMYETSKKTGIRRRLRVSYPEIAKAAMGRKGMIGTHVMQFVLMLGGVVMYIILLGTICADVFQPFTQLGLKEWCAINCCFSLPTLFITKMSIISWFSMFSVFSILSAYIALLAFCFTHISLWDIANIPEFDIQKFPVSFSVILFSYCAHAVLPSIEGSMKKPNSFKCMINSSFLLAAISKSVVGVLMVLTFGANTAEVATTNLNGHPWFSKITSFLAIANVLLAMPLEMFVVTSSFDDLVLKYFPYLNKQSGYNWVWLMISRTLLLNIALLIAVTIPHFGLMMAVVGSFTGTALSFLFPCYCHMMLRWESLSKWQIVLNVSIMFFGGITGVFGLYFSVKGLILA